MRARNQDRYVVGYTPASLFGVARFELTTPASRRQCSTKLSYTPKPASRYISPGRIFRKRVFQSQPRHLQLYYNPESPTFCLLWGLAGASRRD